ncbi:hypothetical protein [Pseudomonas syringae]|uniref:hypothetical protein n=1 Tax=Pseudomonas syringae TaxID=317 RepID=UPI001F3C6B36|nr:hypothetical protein [Pseudomonas syringae]MCF5374147.1 hypothetical protein [Pseudomonas syringae]
MTDSNGSIVSALIEKLEAGKGLTKEDIINGVVKCGGCRSTAEKIYGNSLPPAAIGNLAFYVMLLNAHR